MALKVQSSQLFKVAISGENGGASISEVFASTLTGAGWERDSTDYPDTEKSVHQVLMGFLKTTPVTLSCLYSAEKDPVIEFLKAQKTKPSKFTCLMSAIDDTIDGKPTGEEVKMTGCQVLSCKYPEMGRESLQTAKIEFTFRPGEIT